MVHSTPLITTIVVGLALALVFGALANRFKFSPIVGYLLAGVAIGPFTPGFVADTKLAMELAEIGVILLMFGVGLHFSLKDLMSVKNIAVPGAVVQITIATIMGFTLSHFLGWGIGAGLVFGLALSVASTVVLIRALQERHLIETEQGRIAVGWLIVEDLAMVIALVLLPAVAGLLGGEASKEIGGADIFWTLFLTIGKVSAFVVLMLMVGRRIIPGVLHMMAQSGSRELFRLAVLAIALGTAYGAAMLFGISFALGAFFAGMILGESQLSQRAAEESLPLRDAFAVLFFVSVGMLFNPSVLLENPIPVLLTVAIIIFGKSIAAYIIVRAFGYANRTALIISASLAQIGEFSFILATLGMTLGLLPEAGNDYILAGAIISIMLNPAIFGLIDRFRERASAQDAPMAGITPESLEIPEMQRMGHADSHGDLVKTGLKQHAILVGYGRVGQLISRVLEREKWPYIVIEDNHRQYLASVERGIETIPGNAVEEEILNAANIDGARWLFAAIPDAFEAGQIVARAKAMNADLTIIARAQTNAEAKHLYDLGATVVVRGQDEIARGMISEAFSDPEILPGLRISPEDKAD